MNTLQDQKFGICLDWEMRVNIILGIARGLLYLHYDSKLIIVHGDLKTSNILLDGEMNPKISDFGLSRIVGDKQTEANIKVETFDSIFSPFESTAIGGIAGTKGYMAPECFKDEKISVKYDIFSFGIVLLEIISGRKTYNVMSEVDKYLVDYAWRLWVENKVLDLMDQDLSEVCNADQFVKYVNIGLLCVQFDPNDRPPMLDVFTMLYSEAANVPTPKQPAFGPWWDLRWKDSSSIKLDTYARQASCSMELTSSLVGR